MSFGELFAAIEILLTIAYVIGWLGRMFFPAKPTGNRPLPPSD